MNIFKKLILKIKGKRGITGTDVAVAISVIALTTGIVTAIYINAINKSKDNIRYANAVRIATNVIENIQKKPYEYLTRVCGSGNTKEVNGGNTKVFDTKIPNGFKVKIVATPATSRISGGAELIDIARNVVVDVTYRASNTYKTITLKMLKEKELMDMVNSPDFSLIPNYKPNETGKYYYPLKNVSTNSETKSYQVTSTNDLAWYDYANKTFAVVGVSSTEMEVGANFTVNEASSPAYVWIPRFVGKKTSTGTDLANVQFLFGSSNYKIVNTNYGALYAYGLLYTSGNENATPVTFDGSNYSFSQDGGFAESDGLSGMWYLAGSTANSPARNSAIKLQSLIGTCTSAIIR